MNQQIKLEVPKFINSKDIIGAKFKQICPVREWRSTLRNWFLCQLQSHVTQKLCRISKIRP